MGNSLISRAMTSSGPAILRAHNWTIGVQTRALTTQLRYRSYSAGRLWIVVPVPALLTRFCGGSGVGSGAWVRPDLRIG
jgi:hypothetical protein